jgi:hypothetical protein
MKSAIGQRDALRYETGFQKAGFIGNILTTIFLLIISSAE